MKNLKKKGFTIVELVIVIAVIAVLAAVLIPTFSNVIKNSKESAALSDANKAYKEYVLGYAKDGYLDEDLYIEVNGGYVHYLNGKPVEYDGKYILKEIPDNADIYNKEGQYLAQSGAEEVFNNGTYKYEFTSTTFKGHETQKLGNMNWTLSGEYDDEIGYWGYLGTKGQQFGSKVYTYRSMTLTANKFDKVSKVVVYASGAKNIDATLFVTVGGVKLGEEVALTNENSKYVFSSNELLSGNVVINFSQIDSSVAIYVKSISVTCGVVGDVEESEINKTDNEKTAFSYGYEFTSKVFSTNETKELLGLNWTLSGDGGYWGTDSNGRGHQFGSGNNPYTTMTLTSDSLYSIKKITINASGADGTNCVLKVYVGSEKVGEATLTKTATDYSFDVNSLSGVVKLEFTQTSSVAIYIKSINIETNSGYAESEDDIHELIANGVDYVILQNDITVDSFVIDGPYKFTLDLAGKTINAIDDADGDHSTYGLYVKGGAEVTVTGNGKIYGGRDKWFNIALRASGEGSVINILNGEFVAGPNVGEENDGGLNRGTSCMFVDGSSTINIYGGTFITEASYDNIYFVFNVRENAYDTANINLYAGTIYNANPNDQGIINIAGGNLLMDGSEVSKTETDANGNKIYTVTKTN